MVSTPPVENAHPSLPLSFLCSYRHWFGGREGGEKSLKTIWRSLKKGNRISDVLESFKVNSSVVK